ncbi:hypothetical protein K2173_025701 [Erythroxylum novogranatense]|uniref:Uncharacterized protein n=1 Tax=Erythroxylum novogranatense TaxID=1862640 RepID=A0AAV8SBW4_9ROSI|nr:hypothetical protein K2173_025701 [Erythroxylum novogranatense]
MPHNPEEGHTKVVSINEFLKLTDAETYYGDRGRGKGRGSRCGGLSSGWAQDAATIFIEYPGGGLGLFMDRWARGVGVYGKHFSATECVVQKVSDVESNFLFGAPRKRGNKGKFVACKLKSILRLSW